MCHRPSLVAFYHLRSPKVTSTVGIVVRNGSTPHRLRFRARRRTETEPIPISPTRLMTGSGVRNQAANRNSVRHRWNKATSLEVPPKTLERRPADIVGSLASID